MDGLYNYRNKALNSLSHLFLLLLLFNFACPNLLNNIIILAKDNSRYSHFCYNSKGDMIVDSSAFPVSKYRVFFGLTKNGRLYFDDEVIYTMTVDHSQGRIEGESYLIKLTSTNNNFHGRELICGISKNSGYYVEIYNLENKNMTKYLTSDIFGTIDSDVFSILEAQESNPNYYYYIFTYIVSISNEYYLKTIKTYFSFDNTYGFEKVFEKSRKVARLKTVSCFFTENNFYICIYLNLNSHLEIIVYDPDFSSSSESTFYDPPSYPDYIFFKGIHLKDEIGFFLYFIVYQYYPAFTFLQFKEDKSISVYSNLQAINVNKATFDNSYLLNDILRLNDFQTCYISIPSDHNYIKIVIFTLYKSDTLINIRYYQIEMWNTYAIKIFLNIKASMYKNFISFSFSNCPQSECTNPYSDYHINSLIIFSYPNSTDISLDIIPLLYVTNQKIENDFSFNFEGTIVIENNLFGFVFKGTRIMNYPIGLYLTNITNGNILEVESIILKNENVSLYFEAHENFAKKDYIIEYAYVLEEPDYDDISTYTTDIDDSHGNNIENEKNYYTRYEYTGKSSYFVLKITEDLITDCNDASCILCFTNYTCLTCINNYTFNNNNHKICIPDPSEESEDTEKLEESENQEESDLEETDKSIINKILEGEYKGMLTNDLIKELYEKLKGKLSENPNEYIETKNAVFQLTKLENQKNNNNPNASSVDLGDSEQKIKVQEGLSESDDLLIFKLDLKNNDFTSTYIQYEIYNPKTYNIVSLDPCLSIEIKIDTPIIIDENIKYIYDRLNQSGYNLFNLNDSFYNDICSKYTSENGTDLTLADRKELIYDSNNNITGCQEGCSFQSVNLMTNKVICNCFIQKEQINTNITKINFDKEYLIDNLFTVLKNSNFLVLKCFKLVFSKIGQRNNFGSYMMSSITFIFIIFIFIYIFY